MPVKPTVLQDRYRTRGTAYTLEERAKLGITGRLPAAVETLDEQAGRAYAQLRQQPTDLHKYIYLNEVHDRDQGADRHEHHRHAVPCARRPGRGDGHCSGRRSPTCRCRRRSTTSSG
jgi:hypothetical protein